MSSLFSAKAEVYVEYSNIIYYYQGSINFGESMNITLSSNYPVWVLVTPSSSNAYVSMTASSSPYYYVSSSTLPVLLIVILVIVSFCWWCFLFIIVPMIICNIILKKIRKSKKRKAQYTDTNQPITDEKNYQDEFPLDLNLPKTIKKADTKTTYSIPRFPIQSSARESNVHISQKVLNADQHVEYDPSLPVPSKQTLMTKQTDIMTRKL